MSRLGVKHANQTVVVRADFSGGLNTAASIEGIAENQLAEVINMEIDHATGRLKTVGGTKNVLLFGNIFAAGWDSINKRLLIITKTRDVYAADLSSGQSGNSIGKLTGMLYPSFASWEDGLLIASGGKLQYYNGSALITLNSPKNAKDVYIRAGRVVISDDNSVIYSAVGDETDWSEDQSVSSGDDSKSKFVEAGYKDGGQFIGMVSLSSDIVIIKNNRRVYRLSGEYPDWVITEISRNVECAGRMSFCSVADAVFILGKNEVQRIQTTDQYGDMKPANVASLITSEIQKLPENPLVRYVPPLSQIWIIGTEGDVLMYDISCSGWYKRRFATDIIDVFSVGDAVFIVKEDRIARIDEGSFYDGGRPLSWRFRAQRLVSHNDFLLKRTQISVIPYAAQLYTGEIRVGAVIISLPIPAWLLYIWHNYSPIYKNRIKIMSAGRAKGVWAFGDRIYHNPDPIYGNLTKIFSRRTIVKESRNVYRSKFLDIIGRGSMGGFTLNSITMDIAEV